MDEKRWMTPRQLSEKYKAFSPNWLRAQLLKRDQSGLSAAVAKVGKRVFIDEDSFLKWVESQREVIDDE